MHNYGTDLENIRIALAHAGEHFDIGRDDYDYIVIRLQHLPPVELVFNSRTGEMVEVDVLNNNESLDPDIRVNDVYKYNWSIIEWRVLGVNGNKVRVESDTKDCTMTKYKSDDLFVRENLIKRG